jgi:D-glycero-D-manno-heptose 1,7-bisphosphate phosphatase
MTSRSASKRAVFLDRDGTINRDVGFTHRVADLELLPGAVAGLSRMAALGYRLLIATNQSGVARGHFTEDDVQAFHAALCQRLRSEGVAIDGVYYCPFHPTEGVGTYRRESPLRKPGDGMIRLAATEHGLDLAASFVVGDKKSDVLAGQRAGCRTILVRTGMGGADEGELPMPPDFVADDLLDAADYIAATPVRVDRSAACDPQE